jgi:hypothetical protein
MPIFNEYLGKCGYLMYSDFQRNGGSLQLGMRASLTQIAETSEPQLVSSGFEHLLAFRIRAPALV